MRKVIAGSSQGRRLNTVRLESQTRHKNSIPRASTDRRDLTGWLTWRFIRYIDRGTSTLVVRISSENTPRSTIFWRTEYVEMYLIEQIRFTEGDAREAMWYSRALLDGYDWQKEHSWALEGYQQLVHIVQNSRITATSMYHLPRKSSSRWIWCWAPKIFIMASTFALNHRLGASSCSPSSEIM